MAKPAWTVRVRSSDPLLMGVSGAEAMAKALVSARKVLHERHVAANFRDVDDLAERDAGEGREVLRILHGDLHGVFTKLRRVGARILDGEVDAVDPRRVAAGSRHVVDDLFRPRRGHGS